MRVILPTANQIQAKLGFTLIEILIATAVSGIILSVGVVQYNEFNKTQTVKSSALTVKNNLRDAQAKAFSGLKPTCPGSETLTGYEMTFDSDNVTYRTRALCSGGTGAGPTTTYTLASGLRFYPRPQTFTFNVLSEGVSSIAPLPQTLTVGNSAGTKCFGLQVAASGQITDLGAVTCPSLGPVYVLNAGTGTSCNSICVPANGFSSCSGISTTPGPTNGNVAVSVGFPSCWEVPSGCFLPMWPFGGACNKPGVGSYQSFWTYCACMP